MDSKKVIIGGAIALGVAVIAGLGFYLYKHGCVCCKVSHTLHPVEGRTCTFR